MPNPPTKSDRKVGKARDLQLAHEFLTFNDQSKSPFHSVRTISDLLTKAGFIHIQESQDWNATCISPAKSYFVTRGGSSIIAFTLGHNLQDAMPAASASGSQPNAIVGPTFTIIAAHTDSPCFKVKPMSTVRQHGYLQLGVECYGGGLWHTWFDRDLTVAGRVIVRADDGALSTRLVTIPKPILRIPNLAIHLSRQVASEGFKVNKETDTVPILATALADSLNGFAASPDNTKEAATSLDERHPPLLLAALAAELEIAPQSIVDLDLCVADTQPAAIGGVLDEFVMASRLDNLASCFTAVSALIKTTRESARKELAHREDRFVRVAACFDHEEVGSRSANGADSSFLGDVLTRIADAMRFDYHQAIANSLLVSADMAHAIHPNYSTKHEARHRPVLGAGLVIKTNQNQRYGTSGISGFLVREAAKRAGNVPIQEFVVPNDKPCGSTVGPLLASRTGIMTVDVGQPQLSMHSVREMCSVHDFSLVLDVFIALYLKHVPILEELNQHN